MWNTYWKKCSRILMVIAFSSLYFYNLKIPIMAYNYFYSWKKLHMCIYEKCQGLPFVGTQTGLEGSQVRDLAQVIAVGHTGLTALPPWPLLAS